MELKFEPIKTAKVISTVATPSERQSRRVHDKNLSRIGPSAQKEQKVTKVSVASSSTQNLTKRFMTLNSQGSRENYLQILKSNQKAKAETPQSKTLKGSNSVASTKATPKLFGTKARPSEQRSGAGSIRRNTSQDSNLIMFFKNAENELQQKHSLVD